MLLTIMTDKSVQETAQALQAAVVNHKFGVMQIHNLQETMQNKGVTFERECLIFEVCNPHSAKQVLMANMGISTALPCRISIYHENGKTVLATLKPSMMLSMFNVPELTATAQDVENTMLLIMKEASR